MHPAKSLECREPENTRRYGAALEGTENAQLAKYFPIVTLSAGLRTGERKVLYYNFPHVHAIYFAMCRRTHNAPPP